MVFIISHFIGMALADIPITEKLSIDGNMRYRIEVDGREILTVETPNPDKLEVKV